MPKLSEVAGQPAAEAPKRLRLSDVAPVADVPSLAAAVEPPAPRTGRDASGQMLFPSAFIETPPNIVPAIVSDATRMAQPFRGFRAPTGEMVPDVARAPTPVELPASEALFERAQAGLTDIVAGGVRGLGEFLDPASYFDFTQKGQDWTYANMPQARIGRILVDEAEMASELAKAKRQAASVGDINPQSVDELASMALDDPEGAIRYLSGIGAESAPAILAAMATRNPRAAEILMGGTSMAQTFGQQRLEGVAGPEATRQALAAGLIESAASRVPADIALGGAPLGRRLLLAPGAEAASEATAGGAQSVAQDIIAGGKVDAEKAKLQTVLGAAVGGPLGLGEAVLGRGPAPVAPPVVQPPPARVERPWTPMATPPVAPAAAEPPAPATPVAETAKDSTGGRAAPNTVEALLADPELAALLDALPGAGAATPSEAQAPAPPVGQGGSPVPVGGDSVDLTPDARNKRLKVGESSVSYTVDEQGAKVALVRTPKEARGQGGARAAMTAFLQATDAQGIPVTLTVAEQDKTTDPAKLQSFYESLGFTVTGQTDEGAARMTRLPGAVAPAAAPAPVAAPAAPVAEVAPLGEAVAPPARFEPEPEPERQADRSLSFLRREVGWEQMGGRMIRGGEVETREDTGASFGRTSGDVIGRTPWIPRTDPGGRPSTFWRNRPGKLTEKEANIAFDRYEAGEVLTKRQQAFIDYAKETAAQYAEDEAAEMARLREFDQDEQLAALMALREDVEIAPEQEGEALALYDLIAQAMDNGAEEIDVTPSSGETDREYAARLWTFIRGPRNVEPRATQEDRSEGDQDIADAEPAPAPTRGQAGLFGAPTARETVDAARRDRDAQRDGRTGTGRTDMAAGAGELFAGPRPDQADLDRAPEATRNTRQTDGQRAEAREALRQVDGTGPRQTDADAEFDAQVAETERGIRNLRAIVSPEAAAIREKMGIPSRNVTVVDGPADLDPELRERLRPSALAEGLFDPVTGQVFVFRIDPRDGQPITPKRAVWVAFHEVAGHLGIRGAAKKLAGNDRGRWLENLMSALESASRNPFIERVAAEIRRQQPDYGVAISIEEALAEMAAAIRTGDYAEIEGRYKVRVPLAQRNTLAGDIARLVDALRAFLRRFTGDTTFTDAEVYRLLDDAWRYAETAPVGEAGLRGTDAPESRQRAAGLRPSAAQLKMMRDMGEDAYIEAITGGADFQDHAEKFTFKERPVPADATLLQKGAVRLPDGRTVDLYDQDFDPSGEIPTQAIYAVIDGEAVGFIGGGEVDSELTVANDYRRSGIGAALQRAYRARAPFAPTGGMTRAGERLARALFREWTGGSPESRRARMDGRGQRSIEHNGATFVKRGSDYYLADAKGQPQDFNFVREAEAEAARVGGEVRQDAPTDGRRTWSVTLPEGVRMAAEREFAPESRRANEDYAGEHQAPMADSGAPGHDVTGGGNFYPDDVYGANAVRYYGTGNDRLDSEAFNIVSGLKGRPNKPVKIYRAVPKEKSKAELLADVQARMAQIMRRGGDSPGEYDRLFNERERLNALPDEAPVKTPGINAGDWVTITRGYAKDHGESVHGKGGYAVVSKTVKAKEIFTNGDSIQEWGYDPFGSAPESRRSDQTETPEFKRWFGDSKVVDADGRPLVVYHGSNGPLERVMSADERMALFDKRTRGLPANLVAPERRALEQNAGALWFTADEGVAEGYAGQREGDETVTSVYLSIENPLDLTEMDASEVEAILSEANGRAVQIGRDYGLAKGIAQAIVRNNGALVQWAKANGYDGLIYPDTDVRGRGMHTSYVTFMPGQVKSATGNRGTFDPLSPSILESRRPEAPEFKVTATTTAQTVIKEGRALSLVDAATKAGLDLGPLKDAYARKDGPAVVAAMDALIAQLQPAPKRTTGIKNAVTDAERAAANRDPILRDAIQTNEDTVVQAMRELRDDPMAGDEAIARISRGGDMSLADEGILLVYKTQLMNERNAAADVLADPSASESRKEAARETWARTEAKIGALDVAASAIGTEAGRTLQFRRRMMQEDFTLAALERKERARLERPLTREESAKIKEMADTIATLQARVDKLNERIQNAESESAYANVVDLMAGKGPKKRPTLDALRKAADEARARLKATPEVAKRGGQSGAIISPTVFYDYAVIGAFHIADGAAKFADWVRAMSADLGERFDQFKDEHPRIFRAAKAAADKPLKADATVAEVMASVDKANITPKDVRKLVEAHVGEGLRGEPAVVAAVARDLGIDEAQVRRLFVQTAPRAPQTVDEAKQEVRDLRKIIRLEAEIERLEAGQPKPARGAPMVDSPAVAAKKAELAAVRQALRAAARPDPEARYQELRGKQIQKRIADIEARIAAGDFAPRPSIPRALSEANDKAMFELQKAKEAFAKAQFEDEIRRRGPLAKVFGGIGDVFNLARAVMTSFDLSAPLRQGGFIVLGNPMRGLTGFVPMLRSFASAEAEFKAKSEIESRKNAPLYKKYGLELTGIGTGPLAQIEEAYASRWLDKLPSAIGGGLVRGSGRAYTSFLNRLRADSFDAMVASLTKTGVPTEAEGKAIANYINVATGRGPIGGREKAGEVLNTVFFAPRLVASRFQLLAGQPLYGGSARTRRMIAKEYARYLMGAGVVLGLAAFALGDDDDEKPIVNMDPRSADFGKVRVGNTFVDPLSGLAQVTVFLWRMATGETVSSAGGVKPVRQWGTLTDLRRAMGQDIPAHELSPDGTLGFGATSAADLIGRFLRTKLAPAPGAIVNSLSGENLMGEPVTPVDAAQELVTPMSFGDIGDAMEEHGVPKGAALGLLVIFGMGVQTRDEASPLTATETARTDIKERLSVLPVDQWQAEMEAMRKEYGPVMDGVSLAIYKKDGKYGKAGEPRRTAEGMPVLETERLSNQAASRRNYQAALKARGMTDAQITAEMARTSVHHVIPDNVVRQHPLMIRARTELDYDLDQPSNLVGLAKEKTEATESGDELGHWTDHPFYDMEVVGELDAAARKLRRKHGSVESAPKQEVLDAIRAVEDAMRKRIEAQDVPKKGGRLAALDTRRIERSA